MSPGRRGEEGVLEELVGMLRWTTDNRQQGQAGWLTAQTDRLTPDD